MLTLHFRIFMKLIIHQGNILKKLIHSIFTLLEGEEANQLGVTLSGKIMKK